ncbi:MAG: histidine kinase [Actinomycetota bacterium]
MKQHPGAASRLTRHLATPGAMEAAVVVLVMVVLVAELGEADSPPSPWVVALAVISALVLLGRRRQPELVLAITIGARLVLLGATGSGLAMLPVVAVALYTMARHGDRRRSLTIAIAAALVMAVAAAALGDDAYAVELLEEGALMLLPVAVGDALRARDDRIHDLIEAASEAKLHAERLRIARDLHDVVAHGLSAIAIHSGVAARRLDDDPDQAREALELINQTGRSSLEDLRAMVGALRSTADAPVTPTPTTPDDFRASLARAELAGVHVSVHTVGEFPTDAGDAVVVATHRILQEALMNVARHAGKVAAAVELIHAGDHVRLSVVNEPGPSKSTTTVPTALRSTGVGIVGMRERAESLGGTLTAEATVEGGFQVVAELPYSRLA